MKPYVPAGLAFGLLSVFHQAGVSNEVIADKTGISIAYLESLTEKARNNRNLDKSYYDKMVALYNDLKSNYPEFAKRIEEMTAEANADHTNDDEAAAPEGAAPLPDHHEEPTAPAAKAEPTPDALGLTKLEAIVLQQAVEEWSDNLNNKLKSWLSDMIRRERDV